MVKQKEQPTITFSKDAEKQAESVRPQQKLPASTGDARLRFLAWKLSKTRPPDSNGLERNWRGPILAPPPVLA